MTIFYCIIPPYTICFLNAVKLIEYVTSGIVVVSSNACVGLSPFYFLISVCLDELLSNIITFFPKSEVQITRSDRHSNPLSFPEKRHISILSQLKAPNKQSFNVKSRQLTFYS